MRQPLNLREKPRIDLADLKKILLIRLRRIGDVVMTTPAVAVLKAQLPYASISYLIEEPYRELVEGNPHLDEVIIVPRKQNTRDFLRLTQTIRKKRFDCLIDFHGGPRAAWMTLLSGSKLKVGYRIRHKGFLYNIHVPRSQEKAHIHSVENHVNLIRALGIEVNTVPPLFLPAADEGEKEKIAGLVRNCGRDEIKIAVLHVGAGNEFRNWGTENLIRLTDLITRRSNACVLLIGGPEDVRRAETIAKQGLASVFYLAGQLGIR